ncbi:MAG: flagellar hook-length control protein FliK [Kofleriaceae bacterium]
MKATAVAAAPAQVVKADPDVVTPKATKAESSRDFAKQLEKATKPVVKKPTIALGADNAPPVTAEPAATGLAQIIAALVNASTLAAPAPDAPAAKPAIADAMTQKTAATVAEVPEQTRDAVVQVLVAAPKPEAAPEPPLTPLEQAVHDMLTELSDHKEVPKSDVAMAQAVQVAPTTNIHIAGPVAELEPTAPVVAAPPQELVSQNHAHLVFDDPNGRIVMTVAVRGSEVNVTMRASDDSTAAAMARNAGSLEAAMRGRGLQLAQFDAQRDLPREQREKPMYEKSTVKKSDGERFTLEENAESL